MNDLGMNHADMSAASLSLAEAAKKARGATGDTGLSSLASAVPGSSIADGISEMKSAWRTGIQGWSGQVGDFADDVEATSSTNQAVDSTSGGIFDLLGGVF